MSLLRHFRDIFPYMLHQSLIPNFSPGGGQRRGSSFAVCPATPCLVLLLCHKTAKADTKDPFLHFHLFICCERVDGRTVVGRQRRSRYGR